jgi:homoserine O-acetyltransferase
MRALEWAVTEPERVERLLVLAVDAVRLRRPDRLVRAAARRDPCDDRYRGGDYYDAAPGDGPHVGPRRRAADRARHLPLAAGDQPPLRPRAQPARTRSAAAAGYAVESYLDHHADKLVYRFDANSYVVLTEAMNSHDVGRGRGGWRPRCPG